MDEIDFDKVETVIGDHLMPPEKLEKYALSSSGDENKAGAFRGYMGYTQKDDATVASLVCEYDADHPPTFKDGTPHGDGYTTEIAMGTRTGRAQRSKSAG